MKSFSYFVSEHLTHFLRDREIITAEYNSAYIYCFEFIFSNLFFICGILLCGILFTKPVFSVVFLLTLLPMRSFCGGVHAPNRLLCSVLSYLTYFISYILYLWMEGISSSQPVLFVLFFALPRLPSRLAVAISIHFHYDISMYIHYNCQHHAGKGEKPCF